MLVPLAAFTGHLVLAEVFAAAALVGGLGDLYDIADHAYLPNLVDRRSLIEANTKLGMSESAAEIGGPALAGALVSLLTAPIALIVNAATYLASAAILATIRHREPREVHAGGPLRLTLPLDGLALAWALPRIRPLLLMTFTSALFGGFFAALYVIYAVRDLGLTPAVLGVTIAVGGLGALVGAAMAGRIARWLGAGPALTACLALSATSAIFIPLAHRGGAPAAMLMTAQLFCDGFATAALVLAKSMRQTFTPPAALGRVGGAFAAVGGLAAVAGALAGGELGERLGMRPTLVIACAGLAFSAFWTLASPLGRLRSLESV
jgi:predicted MFS family arabinose efflux permease